MEVEDEDEPQVAVVDVRLGAALLAGPARAQDLTLVSKETSLEG